MSGSTTELNLRTAVDADDNADYLTLDLANSLRTIDALFNNVTGHNHSSAHQGGPLLLGSASIADGSITSAKISDGSIQTIDLADGSVTTPKLAAGAVTSAKITPPIDIGGYFRSTDAQVFPSSGAGLELYYRADQGAVVQGYNRGSQTYQPLLMLGSRIELHVAAAVGLTINPGGDTAMQGPLTMATGTIVFNAAGNIHITNDGSNMFLRTNKPGAVYIQANDGTSVGLSAASITFSQNGYYWQGIPGVPAVETNGNIQVDGGVVYFHPNRTVYLQLNGTTLVVGGFTAMVAPTVLYVGGDQTTYFQRDPSITSAIQAVGDFGLNNSLRIHNAGAVISWGPGVGSGYANISTGVNVGRSIDTVYLANHAFVFFDLSVGHNVTCQALTQTSDPRAKASMEVMTDVDCMLRVRQPGMSVYTYQLPPPAGGTPPDGAPVPTPTDIGFDATQVYANSPEFAALDDGVAVGVSYSNMAALLWGALRSLDARCQAKGI